jgi:branched-chain amino acid transport system permease protein
MVRFLEAVIVGLGNGATIALIAVGFVIIYKSTRVINFAQPALMILGGYLVSVWAAGEGMSFFTAVPLAVLTTGGIALVLERLTMRPLVGEPVFIAAIVTVGLDLILRTVVNQRIGPFIRPVGDPWGFSRITLPGGMTTQQRYLIMLLVTGVVVGLLLLFFKRSRMGLAMRATAFDQEVALVNGVGVGAVFALSWLIAGGLAALAGTFVGTGSGIEVSSFIVAFKALPAIIIGGLDSIEGAVVGALSVGVIEALTATYQGAQVGQCCAFLGTNFSVISPFVVMLLVLLVRPYGLFGTPEVERV